VVYFDAAVMDKNRLFSELAKAGLAPAKPPEITEMTGFEQMKELSAGRFGTIPLVK
jgi:hypothetical protein